MPNEHAPLSLSGSKWWGECPGALAYLELHPVIEEPNIDAMLGTAAHKLVEACLFNNWLPEQLEGDRIEVSNNDTIILAPGAPPLEGSTVFTVDQDMIEATTYMVDYVNGRLKELGLSRKCLRIETQVKPIPLRDDIWGTADVVIDAWPTFFEVVDYKHGKGVYVPVKDNPQLLGYSLGVLMECPQDYEEVVYTICQPRHHSTPENGIMSAMISAEDLAAWGLVLLGQAERVDLARRRVTKDNLNLEQLYDAGFLSVGEDGSHCQFCPLESKCPAAYAKAQEIAKMEFCDDPTELSKPPSDPEKLAPIVKWAPYIRKYLEAAEKDAFNLMTSGTKVPGQKIVRGRSSRKWNPELDPEVIAVCLGRQYGIARDKIFIEQEPKFITGPQAEKLIPKKDKKQFNEDFLIKEEGPLVMADESSKKPEVIINPANDFDDDPDHTN